MSRRLQRLYGLAWTGVLLITACQPPTTPPVEVRVGVHEVRVAVPTGWQHQDHGREQRFENGMEQIFLSDLGPATREGFVREVRRARDLFRNHQEADAQTIMEALEPRRIFRSQDRWKSIEQDWQRLAGRRREKKVHPQDVEGSYFEVLTQLDALDDADLETLANRALVELGHDSLRSVADQEVSSISGQPALRIATWDRLNHLGRRNHLFVLSEGNLLCLRTGLGRDEVLEPAFESLAVNLALRVPQDSGGA